MARLLNQKYLGFLEWILHEITEFIELACGPNLKGEVSAQKKQWIANLMAESAPLVYQHSLVGKASTLGKMLKYDCLFGKWLANRMAGEKRWAKKNKKKRKTS